jgi:glycosyltransferase involved in cell wall biosynthesis
VLLAARELGLGGSERQLAETALALDRARFEPHVACFTGGGFRAREMESAGVPVLELGVRSLVSGSALAGAARLGEYAARHGIRLVHAFDVPADLFVAPAARWHGVRTVLTSQRAHRDLTPGLTRHLLRLTDRLADGIVVNSKAVARQLETEEAVPRSMIRLAYNGVDTARFRREGPRAETPWDGTGPVVGVVCALRPEKGLPGLLDAFGQVRRATGARLLIVGDGPVRTELEVCAKALGLGGECHFAGSQANVAEWLRVIDVFVLPSLSEALSNSLLEAMACGCCAIASDTGGNPELIEDGVSGLLFAAGNAQALTARLGAVLQDAGLRRRLATGAESRAVGEFSRDAAVARMAAIYEEFLAR